MFGRETFILVLLLPVSGVAWSQQSSVTRRNVLSIIHGATVAVASVKADTVLAYERRDVGGDGRSAVTAAMNEQAYQTNNRLEASGFKLDTREEEQARLNSALSSFSYEGSSPKRQSGDRASSSSKESKSK